MKTPYLNYHERWLVRINTTSGAFMNLEVKWKILIRNILTTIKYDRSKF